MIDNFTSTVDGAAAFERAHADEAYDDRPSASDLAADAAEDAAAEARMTPAERQARAERQAARRAEDPWSAPAAFTWDGNGAPF
jgi:hypothetical protein